MSDFDDFNDEQIHRLPDPKEIDARESLRRFFDDNREQVFFSRQLEVQNEDEFFHWITNRAVRDLEGEGIIKSEWRKLSTGTSIKLVWHKSYRFYKRSAVQLIRLVEEYSTPIMGATLGLQGEIMILEAFARNRFLVGGRNTSEYNEKLWSRTGHDLDFILERDGIAYGVEVKNTLGYMDKREFDIKVQICQSLGIRPLFVVRMMPKTWIYELNVIGGFALILKYQLYPWSHHELAKRVAKELGLPVDAPKAIEEGTMTRFLRWHKKLV
jgi:hypothetical protein